MQSEKEKENPTENLTSTRSGVSRCGTGGGGGHVIVSSGWAIPVVTKVWKKDGHVIVVIRLPLLLW